MFKKRYSLILKRRRLSAIEVNLWDGDATTRPAGRATIGDTIGFSRWTPNRQVGDHSFQPKARPPKTQAVIPQPAGWGSFIPTYIQTPGHSGSNPPTGRLGIIH